MLIDDLEDCFIYDFLENGTTWEQLVSALQEIIASGDPRLDSERKNTFEDNSKPV